MIYKQKKFYSEWKTFSIILVVSYIGLTGLAFLSDQKVSVIVEGLLYLTFSYIVFFFLTYKTQIIIYDRHLKFMNLFFYRKTFPIDSIIEISKQPTYIMASKTFETLYIFYKIQKGKTKWIGLRNASFSEKTMIDIINEIKRINPSVKLDKAAQKMLDKESK